MPLSEHEQRMLQEMERALYAEDPRFASNLRNTSASSLKSAKTGLLALLSAIGVAGIGVGCTCGSIRHRYGCDERSSCSTDG